ncbi:MAG: C40 family peptidase [Sphingobacteriia bacterium]|nr:C40 family peptidase [Sphingobacteriia bacterium]
MPFVVCIVAVAPLRKENAHRSEMISQLLLGEFAEVLQEERDFLKIKCLYDGYEGWCQKSQLGFVEVAATASCFYYETTRAVYNNGQQVTVSIATPYFKETIKTAFYELRFDACKIICAGEYAFEKDNIIKTAYEYLNVPYLWGGKSAFGIDCSGYVQQVFKLFNIQLPRDAYQQAEYGQLIGFLQEVQCGDLAFFDNAEGKITHVGILLDGETIIHASGNVRVDKIDNAGIINKDTGERTHPLRLIKRLR